MTTQTIEVSLDEVGQILIPEAVRNRIGLSPGMTLVIKKGDQGNVRLRIQSELPTLTDKGGVLVAQVKAISDSTNITRHKRDRRLFDLLQRAGL